MIAWEGLFVGITAFGIIILSVIFGLISLNKARKLKLKLRLNLLSFSALTMFFVGFLWLGPTVDFFLVLFTGNNIDPSVIYVLLNYMWVTPALFFASYLGGVILIPKYKWALVGIFLIISILFELFLWFAPWESFGNIIVVQRKDGLIDASFDITFPTFTLFISFIISAFILLSIGFAAKARISIGLLRKKFIYLSIGFSIFLICLILDSITTIPIIVGFIRLTMMTFPIFMIMGLKT
ncbi:MAG: hypothetical protein ACFFC3_02815 [Candidatus Odinarchaeota archaeon]